MLVYNNRSLRGAASAKSASPRARGLCDSPLPPVKPACPRLAVLLYARVGGHVRVRGRGCVRVCACQATVAPYDFAAAWAQRLAGETQQWEEALVREDARDLLARVGITSRLALVQAHTGGPVRTPLGMAGGPPRADVLGCFARPRGRMCENARAGV